MAVNPVSMAETLRPWRFAGIYHFLVDEELLQEGTGSGLTETESSPALIAETETPSEAHQTTASYQQPVKILAPHHSGLSPENLNKSQTNQQEQSRPSQPPFLPAASWKPEWKAILDKTIPAPILWTYKELGEDLAGKANPERSACLKKIIGNLQLPKGSNVFWPHAILDAGKGLEHDPCHFLSGISILEPKLVILIGPSIATFFAPQVTLSVPYTQQIHKGCLFVLLPEFDALVSSTPLVEKSIIYLRTCFSGIPSLCASTK